MSMRLSMRAMILCGLLALVVGLAVGLLLGFVLSSRSDSDVDAKLALLRRLTADGWSENPEINHRILKLIDPERIRENLRFLSKVPHLAGTDIDNQLAIHIRDTWSHHLDSAELVPYDVLLSYSNHNEPNTVQLLGLNGKVLFNSSCREEVLRPEDDHGELNDAYHAYSPSGSVQADLVFANQGNDEDYAVLKQNSVKVKGNIVLIREGGMSTGNKIKAAQEHGAVGVITYPAPAEVAPRGMDVHHVYPYTTSLPGSGIVRSSAAIQVGDPLTPGYPSINGAYRLPQEEAPLPRIPSQPISYNDAYVLLKELRGKEVPELWIGDFNITYRMGPGFSQRYHKVRMNVNNQNRRTSSFNVIGMIRGSIEPDRYVILGNHRDAWGVGALDPSSGTAMLLEVTRVFGQLLKEGWRPRRSIIFCSWGAEEFGLIGSTEWVEEKLPKLNTRAVTYINTDICVMGNKFSTMLSPILKNAIIHVTKMIPDPEEEHSSLFDAWTADEDSSETEPRMGQLGLYSDFASFIFHAGIPVLDFNWQPALENQTGGVYPTYHTGFETFYLMEKLIDPNFKRHQSCGHVAALMVRYMADTALLPLSVTQMAKGVEMDLEVLVDEMQGPMNKRGVPVSILMEAVHNFTHVAEEWQAAVSKINRQDPIAIRMANDQMMALERAFVSLPTIKSQDWFSRHRLFSSLSAVWSLFDDIERAENNKKEVNKKWQEINRHISDLLIVVHQAADILRTNTI